MFPLIIEHLIGFMERLEMRGKNTVSIPTWAHEINPLGHGNLPLNHLHLLTKTRPVQEPEAHLYRQLVLKPKVVAGRTITDHKSSSSYIISHDEALSLHSKLQLEFIKTKLLLKVEVKEKLYLLLCRPSYLTSEIMLVCAVVGKN